jgi:acyl-CoA dehydrogenase
MHIDTSRILIWRASSMAATRKPFLNGEGSMSKFYAGETAVKVTEEAIQILGGYAYVRENPLKRWH